MICGRESEAHHIMYAEPRGVALKVGDNWVVPICHTHHMEIHHDGNEKRWWIFQGVDPIEWAKKIGESTMKLDRGTTDYLRAMSFDVVVEVVYRRTRRIRARNKLEAKEMARDERVKCCKQTIR